MQKKIIALAIAAAFSAPAFADTTVYGVVDAAVANVSASNQKSDTQVFSGGLAGSRLGVKSSEDLTNGMKASIVLEYGLDVANSFGSTTTTSGIGAARQQMLAVSSDFGTVAAGYLQTTGYDFSRFDPTSGSLVSPLHNITGAAGSNGFMIGNNGALKRASRALAYISPELVSGLTVAVNYTGAADANLGNLAVADTAVDAKGTAYLVSVNYTAGPLSAAIVSANLTNRSNSAKKETAIGASYDLGVAKLSATYQVTKDDAAANSDSNNVMSVGAVVPVGPGAVAVSYAKARMTAAGSDKDASGMTVAWLQGLSKTTTFYAAYSKMGQGSASTAYSVAGNAVAATSAGADSAIIAAGVNKKF